MTIRSYLMSMSVADRAAFAQQCRTTRGHLQNVANGFREPAPILCVAIEAATNGAVTRRDLRPDDWHLIWPELAKSEPNPPPAPAHQAPAAINPEPARAGAAV